MTAMLGSAVALFAETLGEWYEDRAPRLGAALAYYMVFALAPGLIFIIGLAARAGGRGASAEPDNHRDPGPRRFEGGGGAPGNDRECPPSGGRPATDQPRYRDLALWNLSRPGLSPSRANWISNSISSFVMGRSQIAHATPHRALATSSHVRPQSRPPRWPVPTCRQYRRSVMSSPAPLREAVAIEMKQLAALSNLDLPLWRSPYHELPA
jgi:hypothetical protein